VGGGGGGEEWRVEGLGWVKWIGGRDKFHHIVKENVIGLARIVCLCFVSVFYWKVQRLRNRKAVNPNF